MTYHNIVFLENKEINNDILKRCLTSDDKFNYLIKSYYVVSSVSDVCEILSSTHPIFLFIGTEYEYVNRDGKYKIPKRANFTSKDLLYYLVKFSKEDSRFRKSLLNTNVIDLSRPTNEIQNECREYAIKNKFTYHSVFMGFLSSDFNIQYLVNHFMKGVK